MKPKNEPKRMDMSGPLSQQPGQPHPFFLRKSEPGKPLHISIRKKYPNHPCMTRSAISALPSNCGFNSIPTIRPWPYNEPDSGFTTIRQSVSITHSTHRRPSARPRPTPFLRSGANRLGAPYNPKPLRRTRTEN